MVLTVTIGDGKQMFERLGSKGLQGEEFIKLVFNTPTRDKVNLLFHVTLIHDVSQTEHGIGDQITLVCITKEKIISDARCISRSYNTTLSACVKNIFENDIQKNDKYLQLKTERSKIWRDKKLFVHDTVGIENYIIPGLQAFNAIRWCAIRAFGGSEFPGSYYTFYEDNKGFHFANIEQLIKESTGGPLYTYNPMQSSGEFRSKAFFRSIQNLSSIQVPDMNARINNGTFKHNVRTIDLIGQTTTDQNFDMIRDFDKFAHTGKFFNTSKKFHEVLGGDPYHYLLTKDTTRRDQNFENIIGRRNAFMDLMNSFQYQLSVYGDTSLNVGHTIFLDLPESGTDEGKSLSQYSGVYFITGLQHTVDRAKFNTSLSVSKDSLDFKHAPPAKAK